MLDTNTGHNDQLRRIIVRAALFTISAAVMFAAVFLYQSHDAARRCCLSVPVFSGTSPSPQPVSVLVPPAVDQTPKQGDIITAAFSADGGLLVVSGRATDLWEVSTGRCLLSRRLINCQADAVAISPDGQYIAFGGSSYLRVWDTTTGQQVLETLLDTREPLKPGMPGYNPAYGDKNVMTHVYSASRLAFSPDGKTLATIVTRNWDSVTLFAMPDGERKAPWRSEANAILKDVRYSPDGRFLLATGELPPSRSSGRLGLRGGLYCWDASSGKPLWSQDIDFHAGKVEASPDGQTLVVGSTREGVRRMTDGSLIGKIVKNNGGLEPMAYSADGRMFVMADSKETQIYSIDHPEAPLRILPIKLLLRAQFSPDGAELLTIDRSGNLERWSMETGRNISQQHIDAEDRDHSANRW